MKENRLDLIDWESVVMEPMQADEGTVPYEHTDIPNKGKNGRIAVITTAKFIRAAVKILICIALITVIYIGAMYYRGDIEPPEFTYGEVIGLLTTLLGLSLWLIFRRLI